MERGWTPKAFIAFAYVPNGTESLTNYVILP
jgi:hypothetical protein